MLTLSVVGLLWFRADLSNLWLFPLPRDSRSAPPTLTVGLNGITYPWHSSHGARQVVGGNGRGMASSGRKGGGAAASDERKGAWLLKLAEKST